MGAADEHTCTARYARQDCILIVPVSATVLLLANASLPAEAPSPSVEAAAPQAQVDNATTPAVAAQTLPQDAAVPAPAASAAPAPPAKADPNSITVEAKRRPSSADPFENINEKSYEVVQGVDKAFVAPVASVYRDGLPRPLRDGLHNVLYNLDEPVAFVNFVLQLKPHSALKTLGRFMINSTLGIGGLFDIAKRKPFRLPYRHNGFANTMGYYGIGPGPYAFLPIVGPTTLRDGIGLLLDRAFIPTLVRGPFKHPAYSIGASVVRSLDYRVEFDDTLRKLNVEAKDPYAATRTYYLAIRQAEIDALHGKITPVPDPSSFAPKTPAAPAPAPVATPEAATPAVTAAGTTPAEAPAAPAPATDTAVPPTAPTQP